jgi:hypothetical protein
MLRLPLGKLIEVPHETKCSRCGRVIGKGGKCVAKTYMYYSPRNPFIVYIVTTPRIPKIGYRILCEECSKDSVLENMKKDLKRDFEGRKETLRKIVDIFRQRLAQRCIVIEDTM